MSKPIKNKRNTTQPPPARPKNVSNLMVGVTLSGIADELKEGLREIFNSDRLPVDDEQKPKK